MNENSPKQLFRSGDDRMLAGVAGGLANYFGVDPVLMRIGFAILGLTGIGLLAYLALYIFVPEDDGWGNPVYARDRNRVLAGGAIAIFLIGIPGGFFPLASLDWWWGVSAAVFWLAVLAGIGYGIYWLLSGTRRERRADAPAASGVAGRPAGHGGGRSLGRLLAMTVLFSTLAVFSMFLAFTSAWGAAVGGTGVIAVAVILCGALLVFAAFKRPMRWLIVPALALALPAVAVEAAGYEVEGGYGNRVIRPALLTDIPNEGYEMAAGNMTIDLRRADWRPNSKVRLPARINFGQISVLVPRNVCVASDIEVWAGGFEIIGESDSGFQVDYQRTMPSAATPQLIVEGQVDGGWIEVLRKKPSGREDFRDHHGGLVDPDARQPAHCLRERESAKHPRSVQPESAPQKGPNEHQSRRASEGDGTQHGSAPQKGPNEHQSRRASEGDGRAEG